MKIRLRIATPQDAQLIHDTYGYYVLTSTATFNEVNSSVEARAEEIRSQLELYPWLIAEDETGRYLGYACAEAFRPQTGYRYFAELTIFLAPDAPRRSGIGRWLYQACPVWRGRDSGRSSPLSPPPTRAAWPCTVPSGLPKPRALYAAATSTASG